MITILKEKFTEKSFIGVRTIHQEWDEVIIGFIQTMDGSNLVIDEIDEFGASLGETTIDISEILSVEFDDQSQKKLKAIVDSSVNFKADQQVTIWKKGSDLQAVMEELIKEGKITTLFFDEDFFVTGKITELNKKWLVINNISVAGEDDGFSIHSIEKLIGLRYNGKDELKIKFLFDNNK